MTVPNNECLGTNLTYCPFCDTEFHKVQHLRFFNKIKLRATLESHGFRVQWCEELDFSLLKPRLNKRVTDISLYDLYITVRLGIEKFIIPRRSAAERVRVCQRYGGPHLVAVVSVSEEQ